MNTAKCIKEVVSYFEEEEGITHQKIEFQSELTVMEFRETLEGLRLGFPQFELNYSQREKQSQRQSCHPTNQEAELLIYIPARFFNTPLGVHQFSFQSRLKNIFGTLSFELVKGSDGASMENKQFMTTSIGE